MESSRHGNRIEPPPDKYMYSRDNVTIRHTYEVNCVLLWERKHPAGPQNLTAAPHELHGEAPGSA
jgi:hypothetical protein